MTSPDDPEVIRRIGLMCLALPDTAVKLSHGSPYYTVRGKGFAWTMNDHHGSGRMELWVKGAAGAQDEWIGTDPDRYYRPAYVGAYGWVGVWLDVEVDWPAVVEILVDGYLDRLGPRAAARLDPLQLGALVSAAR